MGEGGRKERRGKSLSFHNKASKKKGGKIGKDKTDKTQEGHEFWTRKSALTHQRLLRKAESYILSLVSYPQKEVNDGNSGLRETGPSLFH